MRFLVLTAIFMLLLVPMSFTNMAAPNNKIAQMVIAWYSRKSIM